MSKIMFNGHSYSGGTTDNDKVEQNILPELTIRPLLLANSQTNSAEIAECYKDRRLKYGTGTLQVVGDTTGSYTGAKIETIAYNKGYSNVNVRSFNGNDVRTEIQMYADSTKAALRSVTKNNAAEVSKDLISVDVDGNLKTDCVVRQLLSNYIKVKEFTIPQNNISIGMTINSYVSLDSGYKFLAWLSISTVGFVMGYPMYFENPTYLQTKIWWSTSQTISGTLRISYLEIKDI